MAKLTTRSTASGVTTQDFIHIVITGDTTQDPNGSSYKASIEQVFDALSGYCISDLYVSNIHSCSPLRINPLDEGNVYFGSTSGVTIDISSGGNIMNLGSANVQSDNSINPYTIVAGLNTTNTKGFVVNFDNPDVNLIQSANNNTSGTTRIKASSILASNKHIQLEYNGDDYIRTAISPVNGIDFYKNKGIVSIGSNTNGMIINISQTGNTGNLWFEQNGNSIMYLKGGPLPSDGSLGLRLNPDGTEIPTANLQVGGTGTTGTFKYVDGNELNGWVLTSDNDGNATWQAPSGGGSVFTGGTVNGPTNFTNGLSANTISATTYYNLPGSSSGNCFVDFYVRNVHGCSPITIMDETQFDGCYVETSSLSFAHGNATFAYGNNSHSEGVDTITSGRTSHAEGDSTITYGESSHAEGRNTKTGTIKAYLGDSIVNGLVTLDATYGNVTGSTEFSIDTFLHINDTDFDNNYGQAAFKITDISFNGTNTIITLNDLTINTSNVIVLGTNVPPASQGGDIVSEGKRSHAEGNITTSIGDASHAEGIRSISFGLGSHAEGSSISIGVGSHAEGGSSYSVGAGSHAEGNATYTFSDYSHTEGSQTITGTYGAFLATGVTSGVIYLDSKYGNVTSYFSGYIFFDDSDYDGNYGTTAFRVSGTSYGTNSVIYLYNTSVSTTTAFVNYKYGDQKAGGRNSHAEGISTIALGDNSHSEGDATITFGIASSAKGKGTRAIGNYSEASGNQTIAIGNSSHAEGTNSIASGDYSHAEGSSYASGIFSHAEGDSTTASGQYSHSQNKGTVASGDNSHAGGVGCISYGIVSFAHGDNCDAYGPLSVSLGGMNNFVNSGDTDGSAILGGYENEINYITPSDEVRHSAIVGGSGNTVNSFRSAIIGGENNTLTGPYSVILGGNNITGTGNETVYVPNIVLAYSGTPSSSSDTIGEPGSLLWDNTYFYYKDNVGWKRISGSTF
jgi:hypothetical protein